MARKDGKEMFVPASSTILEIISQKGDDETLKWWMTETIIKDYSKNVDKIGIEIDAEWVPGKEGWHRYKNDKFIKL